MQKQIGDKVTIQIARPAAWTKPFPEHFNGRHGVVEAISSLFAPIFLVRFAKPVAITGHPYYERSGPYEAFWFYADDLNG